MNEKCNVLIVDDEESTRRGLSRALSSAGFACVTVGDGPGGVRTRHLRPVYLTSGMVSMCFPFLGLQRLFADCAFRFCSCFEPPA